MRYAFSALLILLLACGPYFYHAPPSLGTYPERIAAKRWPQVFEETAPLDPRLPSSIQMDETCRGISALLGPLATEKRMAEIDRLLRENRSGDYSSRRANLLHELRELAANDASFNDAKSYIEWRVSRIGFMPQIPISVRPWNVEPEEFEKQRDRELAAVALELKELDDATDAAAPSLQAYWKTQRAAYQFEIQQYEDAARGFQAVRENHPEHPRAEVAALMEARCLLEQSRVLRNQKAEPADVDARLNESAQLLEAFLSRYPKGRFAPDAEGWLGAIAFDRGQWGTAVKQQLARLERQPTREITRSVLRECDRIFEELLSHAKGGDFDEWGIDPESAFDAAAVARHPMVARLFVQHCIDPAASIELPLWFVDRDTSGRETIDFLNKRILNPRPFVRSAMRELGRELMASKSMPDDTSLTLLAWAATEDGEHEQALALLDQIKTFTDESLQAKAIVLQRLGRDKEAVAVFNELDGKGIAHLAGDLRYRRSLSLFRSGQAGRAMVEIIPAVYPIPPSPEESNFEITDPLRPHSQLLQWLDTMIQFSPLSELESAFAALPASSRQRDVVGDALRGRALASRDFTLASRYLTGGGRATLSYWEWQGTALGNELPMTSEIWNERVTPLVALYEQLAKAPESKAAEIHLAIAKHWKDQRGKLSMPSLAVCYYAASEPGKQELLRRRNAKELGFAPESIHRELDHRDEATHALEHALEAAKSGDPSIAAAALELANQCIFRRAEVSIYQKSRALETSAGKLSRDIYQQLVERFPGTPEAKRAVHFAFGPVGGPWMPGDYNSYNAAEALVSAMLGMKKEIVPDQGDAALEKIGALQKKFDPFDTAPFKDLNGVRKEIEKSQHELSELRAHTDPANQLDVLQLINRLDDLHSAASVKGASVADFNEYAGGNMDKLPPGYASLLEFRKNLSPIMSPEGFEEGPRNDTIAAWRDFLLNHPDSPMAEAASFRMTRLIARQFRSSRRIAAIHFPDAPIPEGYKHVLVERSNPANDPKAVLAAIRDHEDRFPQGRYRDDLNLLRAGALMDNRQYAQSLLLVENILQNSKQSDLHVLAALEFADMAQQLLEPSNRAAIAAAFRRTPGAMAHLLAVVKGDTFLSRLQPLMAWVEGRK